MLTIRAMSDGKGYSSQHLEHSDYYAEGERVTGVWQGRAAELLGLSGPVETEEFEALRQGLDPGTHEFLRIRRSADRTPRRSSCRLSLQLQEVQEPQLPSPVMAPATLVASSSRNSSCSGRVVPIPIWGRARTRTRVRKTASSVCTWAPGC